MTHLSSEMQGVFCCYFKLDQSYKRKCTCPWRLVMSHFCLLNWGVKINSLFRWCLNNHSCLLLSMSIENLFFKKQKKINQIWMMVSSIDTPLNSVFHTVWNTWIPKFIDMIIISIILKCHYFLTHHKNVWLKLHLRTAARHYFSLFRPAVYDFCHKTPKILAKTESAICRAKVRKKLMFTFSPN